MTADNVFVGVFDSDILRYYYPEWDALTKTERYTLLRNHVPWQFRADQNVTCVEMHRWLAQEINPEINIEDEVATLFLGDGGTTTSSSDTALNNKVGDIDITDSEYDRSNEESHFNTFIDSTELNGNTLNELALVSDDDRFLNHAGIDPAVDKTNTKTLIIEVILGFTN